MYFTWFFSNLVNLYCFFAFRASATALKQPLAQYGCAYLVGRAQGTLLFIAFCIENTILAIVWFNSSRVNINGFRILPSFFTI